MYSSRIWPVAVALFSTTIMVFSAGCGGGESAAPSQPAASSTSSGGGDSSSSTSSSATTETPREGWGSLSGRFVYGGSAPEPSKLNVTKDTEVCGKHELIDESLLVGPDGGLANVVIFLRSKGAPVHESYQQEGREVMVDNKDCRFEPHVQLMTVADTLILHNADPVGHNTNLTPLGDTPINPLLNPEGQTQYKFSRAQLLPVEVTCNIHPWMKAYVLPRDNPYMALSDADGNFTIENLPAGTWEFQVWHERTKALETPDWPKGRFEITIEPGETTSLDAVTLQPALFK